MRSSSTKRSSRYSSKQKRKQRTPIVKPLLGVIFFILLGVGVVYGLNQWEYINVSLITVRGNDRVSDTDIQNLVSQKLDTTRWRVLEARALAFVPVSDLETEIEGKFPSVKEAKITRRPPDEVRVTLIEREPMLLQCADSCYIVSESGHVMAKSADSESNLPKLAEGGNLSLEKRVMSEREAMWLYTILFGMEHILELSPEKIEVEARFREQIQILHVFVQDGYYIKIDDATEVLHQMRVLRQVFEERLPAEDREDLTYVDIRIKDRIFYK